MPPETESPNSTSVHLQTSAVGPMIRLATTLHQIAAKRKAKLAAQAAKAIAESN